MKKLFLALLALCCAIQTHCSTENVVPNENIVPKSHDSEYRERISLIAKSCSSEHGIPTLHEMAFKKLEPAITEAITDLIDNKYDDERDKQNKRNYIDRVAHYDSYLLLSKFINAPIESNGVRLLHQASASNNSEITQYLLDNGALVNQQDDDRDTPLHYAANHNADKAIPILITHGADVNQQDDHGWTPLRLAAYQNADKAIPLLITAGANVNQQDNDSWTPLHRATWNNADKAILLLITAGALVNQQDNDGWTPLHHAVLYDADKAILLLIEAGADITIQNRNHETPRMLTNNPATLKIFDQAIAARPLKQKSAIKIQAVYRGFIARKNK
ncbi:MAG: ankyrin repeat domain-containing protein [Candidatus Chromulinivorax sp.]|nr:ankyrin repeat domain-containing protein [Candidatus Chromulinivorax sp.]